MQNNNVQIVITADGRRLEDAMTRSGKAIKTFGDRTIDTFKRVGQTIQHVGDRLMTPFTSIASMAGITMAGKSVIDLDARLARLAIQAGKSAKEMMVLKKTLFDMGAETYQTPEDLLAAMEQIVEKTGDYQLAVSAIQDMGYAASASGANLQDIGALTSNLSEKFGIAKKEIREAFDILIEQGKTGAFTLAKMAGLGERLFTAAASWGMKGKKSLREFGAFIQIARTGSGNEEQATTAVERTFADLIQNHKKVKEVTGVSIFDPEQSRKQGRAVTRNFSVVMKEIIARTKGDQVKLRKIFGDESIRAVNAMALLYQETGDFSKFDELVDRGGDGAQMMKDFAFWTETATAKLNKFKTQLSRFANDNLAGPIELLTKALDTLNNHPVITKGGIYAILGLGGILTIGKLISLISELKQILGGNGGKKGAGGPSLPGGGLGIPVHVTNWPSSMGGSYKMPGAGTGTPGTGTGVPGQKKLPSSVRKLGGLAVGALTNPFVVIPALFLAGGLLTQEQVERQGGWRPPAVTYDPFDNATYAPYLKSIEAQNNEAKAKPMVQNDINMNITIDRNDRAKVSTGDTNTNIEVNLRRGSFL